MEYVPAAEATHKPALQLASLTVTSGEAICEPLDVIAGKIRALLVKSEDQRLAAATLLAEARVRVEGGEAGNIGWQAWCRKNVERSARDVRRLLAYVKSDDPAAKREHEREAAREGMARLRQRTNVSPPEVSPAAPSAGGTEDHLITATRAVTAMSDRERTEFAEWFRGAYPAMGGRLAVGGDFETEDASSPAQIPADECGLAEAFDALQGDDHIIARNWVMRGKLLGHPQPEGGAGAFCTLYAAAAEETQRKFLGNLVNDGTPRRAA